MKRHSLIHRPGARGFTLVELLVSIGILSIMLIGLATMMGFVIKTWVAGINSVDNFTKARVVMNLLDRDIQMMVLRRDLAAFVDSSATPNPACAFYTNVQGYTGASTTMDTRTISLVRYQLTQNASSSVLQRLNYGSNFINSGITPTIGTTTNLPKLDSSSNINLQTEALSAGVVAFQWQFVDGTGAVLNPPYTLTSTPPSTSSPPTGQTPFWFDFVNLTGTYNPRIVVVSMVVLSTSAYRIAVQTGNVQNVVDCFSAANAPLTSTNPTYSQAWNTALTSPSFLALPATIRDRGSVQVFERHIPLPINP